MTEIVEFVHGHLFCGIAGGAEGFRRGEARLGNREVRYRCAGGVDVDAGAIEAFTTRMGVPGSVLDLFSRDQYIAFHGREPPAGWHEATPADVLKAMGNEHLHCLFTSPPCKGYSGLLSERLSQSARYQALNALALRGVMLALEAYKDDPIEFVLLENVPRIQTRGRSFLDQIIQLLHAYGYATAETTHDCGELGKLAQSRKRFLLVARHMEKVPPFLYEPQKHPLISVGRLLEKFTLPGDPTAGPMHRIPMLQWKTWVRLAFVEAGSDWRSLQKLRVENGFLTDYALAPEVNYHNGVYGVRSWGDSSHTVTGEASPSTGAFSVADPRVDGHFKSIQLGVRRWSEPAATVTANMSPGQGPCSVADPRYSGQEFGQKFGVTAWDQPSNTVTSQRSPGQGRFAVADPRYTAGPRGAHFNNVYRVVRWADVGPAFTAGTGPSAGGISIADPRVGYGPTSHRNKLAVVGWEGPSKTVTGATQVQGGALAVADPRPGLKRADGDHYRTSGHYGVVPWDSPSFAVTGTLRHDNGHGNVADPRLPGPTERLSCIIRAIDGTWHRPFTTLELAALQGLVDPDDSLSLPGTSDSQHREWIGNAVPPGAACAVASAMGHALLLARSGETFVLSATPVWVRPISIAISMSRHEEQ